MTTPAKISLLGAGSWGTALAILAAQNGCQTLLWGHNPAHIANLKQARKNQRYLPDLNFPENLQVTDDLAQAANFSDILLISVPSHAFQHTILKLKNLIQKPVKIVWATKGFNPADGSLLHTLVTNIFPNNTPIAVLSGPTFAKEVARNLPTALTIAANNPQFAQELSAILHNSHFRIYTSDDLIGVQVGGAVKNVLAIAAGIADGLGFGANTRAALITRGLNEVMRLGIQLGGKPETLMGLAGLGDLLLTCTDNQSRNRSFGLAIGAGKNHQQAIQAIGQEIEGISAAKETYLLARKHNIDMPIIEQTYKVLYEHLDPKIAVKNLLNREQTLE